MNLYLLEQTENNGYDTYDKCVVAAESEERAVEIHPSGDRWNRSTLDPDTERYTFGRNSWAAGREVADDWASKPSRVAATLIGTALEGTASGTVLCTSFNAG